MRTIISVENISKVYRLGQIGSGTMANDLKAWWAARRGKPNPLLRVDEGDPSAQAGEEIWALKDVSFSVGQGEVLGIIGRNGAGKSTLLKILSRVTAPTQGKIKIRGRIASLLEVGTGFHPELTGRENIFLNGAILGMSRKEIERKFDEIVDFSEVEQFIDTPVKRYSSGMYVRLAFAVAASLEPEILIVDEVLAVGDAEFQKKCLGKMGESAEGGRTVLFVSHNMAAIESLCKRVLLIKSGRLVQDGPATQVIGAYLAGSSRAGDGTALDIPDEEREGSGLIRFVDWTVTDETLGTGRSLRTGQPCTFEIGYVADGEAEPGDVDVAITLKDVYGKAIVTGATHFMNSGFGRIPRQGKFICRFDSLPLMPNTYQVHLWCGMRDVMADKIENAGVVQVYESDIYGTGRMPKKKHGIIAAENFHWDVVGTGEEKRDQP